MVVIGLSYDPDPEPARRKRRKARRKSPIKRLRRIRGAKLILRARPYLSGIGGARIGEKIMDILGLNALNPIVKPISAWFGGKWKGLASELLYEIVDERTDDIFGVFGLKIPTLGGLFGQAQGGGV